MGEIDLFGYGKCELAEIFFEKYSQDVVLRKTLSYSVKVRIGKEAESVLGARNLFEISEDHRTVGENFFRLDRVAQKQLDEHDEELVED